MSKLDGRKVFHLQREIIRMEAIRHWQDGMSVPELASKYSTHKSCVYRWVARRL